MSRTKEVVICAKSTISVIAEKTGMPNQLINLLAELRDVPELSGFSQEVYDSFIPYKEALLALIEKIKLMRSDILGEQ